MTLEISDTPVRPLHRKLLQRVVVIPLMTLVACNDLLELDPHDTLSPETAWNTESDALLGLAGAYSRLRGTHLNARSFVNAGMTDDAYSMHNQNGERNVVIGNVTPTTGGIVTAFYINAYQAISTFNDFLANVDRVSAAEAKRIQWRAEVRFLRALYYYYLSELYGGVPIITEPYEMGDEVIPRGTKEDVVAFVMEDLDFAIEHLPASRYAGHAVRGSAQALRGRVLLANRRFAESAAASNEVISSGHFGLFRGEYKQLFEAAAEANNPEILFSIGYRSPNIEHDAARASVWWASTQPTQDLVDAYEMQDGLPITTSPLYHPARPYEKRDPRLAATVLVPGARMGNEVWWETYFGQGGNTPYNVWKPADRTRVSSEGEGVHSDNDPIEIRYAEVLLNYAEAQNEAAGPDGSVYAAVNAVRNRAGMPDLPPGLGQAQMRERIRHEQRVELAFESLHRYMGLIRWGIAAQTLNGFKATSTVTYVFHDHYRLWPIPQSEIDYAANNGGNIAQNPGY